MIAKINSVKSGLGVLLTEEGRIVGSFTATRILREENRLYVFLGEAEMTLFPDWVQMDGVEWHKSSSWSLAEAVPVEDAQMPIGITADEYLALCEEDPDRADMMERGESDE